VAWEIGAGFPGGYAVFIWGPICTAVESKQEVRRRGASGRGVDHPLTSSAEVKERIELHLYSVSGPSWPILEWT